jgi:sister-chromatid-cohesion protein PDS5
VSRGGKPFAQYFTETLGTGLDDVGSEAGEDDDEDDLNAIKQAHALIKEINRASPGLLLNVIPQVEAQLKVANTPLRTLAASTLGVMLAESPDLAKRYPALWTDWIGRAQDRNAGVRIAVLDSLRPILAANATLAIDVQSALVTFAFSGLV